MRYIEDKGEGGNQPHTDNKGDDKEREGIYQVGKIRPVFRWGPAAPKLRSLPPLNLIDA